jgi:hypothetical protein
MGKRGGVKEKGGSDKRRGGRYRGERRRGDFTTLAYTTSDH